MRRLTKRDWEIIEAALDFILAGENPFDEPGRPDEPDTPEPITATELSAVLDKVAERT